PVGHPCRSAQLQEVPGSRPARHAQADGGRYPRTDPRRVQRGATRLQRPFKADLRFSDFSNAALVNMIAMSDEYFRVCIEAWADDIVIRYGLDAMFDFQWNLWSEKVLPAVRALKARWMKVGDGTVEAFMKDIQVDASSFPGKAFELTFDMPEPDVGIMTFNK